MAVLTVLSFLFVVTATYGDGENGQTTIPKKPFSNLLTFKEIDYREAFKSLDLNNDNEIKIDELKAFYYHKDTEFAIKKFIQLLDTQKTPGSIDLDEFRNFMNKDAVKRQAHEITYIHTLEGRQRFFADEILTYVYLVIDQNAIEKLFDSIELKKDGKLDFNEIKGMQTKLMNGNTQYDLSEGETKLVLAEIGGGSDTISREDFKEYLQDGELGFFFRECRKTLTATGAEYDNACLIRNLVLYTTRYLTEYMMTLVFDALDAADRNGQVSLQDVQEVYGCNEQSANHFLRYITGEHDKEMEYENIRPIMELPAIKSFLEEGCLSKASGIVNLEERAFCLKWKLWTLISKNFFPKFVGVPDLDFIILFEDLDTSNNGVIEPKEDLEKGKQWSPSLAEKFMEEVEHPEIKGKVTLHDFFDYVYEPYMMCGLGECQIIKENNEKLECYKNEMKDMITNVLVKKEVDDFFKFYKSSIIYHVTLEEIGMSLPAVENFLVELGQGDHYVNPVEFRYFVKQQELGRLFITDENVTPKKHLPPANLHEKLRFYLENFMTEYDTVILFGRLDVNGDFVLDEEDIEYGSEVDPAFIERIALYGNKEHATFHEFWMFLNTKVPGTQEPRKHQLEKACGQLNQEKQIICFKGKLKDLH